MPHILDVLKERGFIAQTTFEEELYKQLEQPTTFYVGFDPTADSLHIGSLHSHYGHGSYAACRAQAHCVDGWRNGNDW